MRMYIGILHALSVDDKVRSSIKILTHTQYYTHIDFPRVTQTRQVPPQGYVDLPYP